MEKTKRDKNKGLSISNRLLIVFLGVVILVSTLLTVVYYVFIRNSIEERTRERISQQFETIDHLFTHDLKEILERELHVLASNPILDEFMMSSRLDVEINARALEKLFLKSIHYINCYQHISFVDYLGKEKVRVARTGRIRTYRDLGTSRLFAQIESGTPGSIHAEGVFMGKEGKAIFSMGIHKNDPDIGEFGGAVIIDHSLENFLGYLDTIRILGENPIWVFAPDGHVLKQPLSKQAFLDPRSCLSKGFQETLSFIPLKEGILFYQDLSIIPGKPLIRCAISVPSSLLMKDIRSVLEFVFVVFFLSIIVVSITVYYLSGYLSGPIVELANAAARLAKGDLSTQVRMNATGEVRMLVESFNQMANDLEKTTVSKEYVDNIIKSMIDALIVVSPDRKIIRCNGAACKLLGYQEKEMVGQPIEMVFGEESTNDHSGIGDVFARGFVNNTEKAYLRKDGREVPVLFSASIMRDRNKRIQGMVCVAQDITARKRSEKEKKELEAQLQRAQQMEAIGTLAGGVAHDLNNVLSGIVSYPDLLLMQIPEDSPLREPVLTMQSSAKKAATIVNDLLTMARRGVPTTEVVDLNDVISQYLKSPEYEKLRSYHPGVEVEKRLEGELLNASGSPVHFAKTVMNLVSNAAEAITDEGKIFISTENRTIDKPIKGYDRVEVGDYITLTVSDTGTGISSEDLGRIFEPFYTKKVMGRSGTGLGMAVVWGTIEDHKGYIDVESTEGKGTTFTLYFPATREETAKDRAPLPMEDYRGNGQSVLVVDDVKEQREIEVTMLTTLGYEAQAVSSGEEAGEYLRENTADLIVLDMIMDPGIDGLDTYKRITEIHPGQRAIIASGFSETERVREARRLGAKTYINKPYTLEEIGIAVKNELVS